MYLQSYLGIFLFFYKSLFLHHHNTRYFLTGTLSFLQSSNKYLSMSSSKYIWIYEAVLHYIRNKYHVPCITSYFPIRSLSRSSFLWDSWFTFQSIISKFKFLKYFQSLGLEWYCSGLSNTNNNYKSHEKWYNLFIL